MMKILKRGECAVLPLILKGRWYEMIASCEKREEYRDATPYWEARINNWLDKPKGMRVVSFSRGYREADLHFLAHASHDFTMGAEHPEWGETPNQHYVITLIEQVGLED